MRTRVGVGEGEIEGVVVVIWNSSWKFGGDWPGYGYNSLLGMSMIPSCRSVVVHRPCPLWCRLIGVWSVHRPGSFDGWLRHICRLCLLVPCSLFGFAACLYVPASNCKAYSQGKINAEHKYHDNCGVEHCGDWLAAGK